MLIPILTKHNKRSKLPYEAITVIVLHHFIPTEQPIDSASEAEHSEPEESSDQDITLLANLDLAHQLAHTHLPCVPTPPSLISIATNPVFPHLTPLPLSYAPPPPPPSFPRPPSSMSTSKPTELHIGALEAFDRSYKKSTQWLNIIHILINEKVYDDDNKKVAFALCYIVISPNSTKSSPDLRLPRSISDHSDYSVHPWSPDLGPILDYSDYPWSPTSVPPQITWITWTIWLLGLSMTFYGLLHLDSLVSLSCHSLNLTCTRLALRDPVSTPLRSLGTAPIHSPGSCTLPSLGLVLSPSTTLSAFRHCLSIVLYKPGLCSTSSLVQISRHVLVSSSCHHVTVLIPMPSKFHLSSQLPHLTFLSVPPKSTSDLELRNRTRLVVVPSHRPPLGSHSESTRLVPERIEYRPPLSSPNPRSSLGLTQCHLISASALHPPLIGSERLRKFRTETTQ